VKRWIDRIEKSQFHRLNPLEYGVRSSLLTSPPSEDPIDGGEMQARMRGDRLLGVAVILDGGRDAGIPRVPVAAPRAGPRAGAGVGAPHSPGASASPRCTHAPGSERSGGPQRGPRPVCSARPVPATTTRPVAPRGQTRDSAPAPGPAGGASYPHSAGRSRGRPRPGIRCGADGP